MRERRRFSVAFKRQVVEELLSKASTLGATEPTAGCVIGADTLLEETLRGRRVSRGGIKQRERASYRVEQLEGMVGRLAMENDLLKRAVEYTTRRRKESLLPITARSLAASKGAAK